VVSLIVLLVVIGVCRDVRLCLLVLVIAVGNLLIAARLRGDMLLTGLRAGRLRADMRLSGRLRADAPITGLRANAAIASLRSARLCRGRRLARGLRLFLLLFGLVFGLRELYRRQAYQ